MIRSMFKRLQNTLIEPPDSIEDVGVRHNSRLLSLFLLIMIVMFLGVDGYYLATIPGYMPPWYGYVFLFGSYALNRFGFYRFSAMLTLIMFPLVIFASIVSGEASSPIVVLYLLIPGLILASILLSFWLTAIFALIEILLVCIMPLAAPSAFPSFDAVFGPFFALMISGGLVLISIFHRDRMEADRQKQLRKSEEDYRAIVENAIFGIFQSSPEGRFLRVNSALARIYGYDSQQDLLDSVTNIAQQVYVDPADRIRFRQGLEAGEFLSGFVARNRRKDGSLIWVSSNARAVKDASGKVIYFEGTAEDITEKKILEQERQLSEERYRLISSVTSDYVFSNVQNEKGEIILNWVAGAFEQISGYTVDEFNARGGWVSTIHPDDIEKDAHDMEQLHRNEAVVSEVRTIHKDGSIRWVRNYVHPLWDSQKGELVGIYGAVQDVTERKRIEQERENLIRELEAKNAELEQFTYTVSHDLKAPLITIRGFLGYLSQDARSRNIERLEGDIRRISEAADKMQKLLNDLLELSRVGRVMNEAVEIDLDQLVIEACQLVHGRLQERGVELKVKNPLPKVFGDHQRLLEVFQNLIDNAAKFTIGQDQPRVEIGQATSKHEGFATLYVRDNGIGIASQFHEKIFGLFNRLNPSIEGTGVGLPLVKRIVEFHGGEVWVESAAGEGATFYFTLPLHPAKES